MIKKMVALIIMMQLVDAKEIADPALYTVTKQQSLGTYKPTDLVLFDGIYVSQRIVADLKKLLDAARKDGIRLKVVSGYRSYERQQTLFAQYVEKEFKKDPKLTPKQAEDRANQYSAKPGHSEHQLGTAVDVLSAENNYQFSSQPHLKYIDWLEQNAHRFNFTISYPKNNTEYIYEPWHIRWRPYSLPSKSIN